MADPAFTRGPARRPFPAAQQPASAPIRAGARFTIQAVLDGFPLVVQFDGDADRLAATIDRLRAIGATPPREERV